jgi:hypothetical protein
LFQLLPGKPEEQLTVADASVHDAATATWEGCRTSCASAQVLDRVTLASSAAKASDLDRGGGALRRSGRGAAPASSGSELELREKDAGVCCSGERGGAQVSLCSAPFTDSWRAYALTPSCATTRAGTKPRQTRTG